MLQCPKCKSKLIYRDYDGDLICICGKVFYTRPPSMHSVIKLHNSDPTLSGAEIGRILHITRQRACFLLKKYKCFKVCDNCYHKQDGYCSCRELSEVVKTPNKCPDWSPNATQ